MKLATPNLPCGRVLVLLVFLIPAWVGSAAPAPVKKSKGEKSELKMVVSPDRVAMAMTVLDLEEKPPVPTEALFFDTKGGALQAANLILRVRHKAGTPGTSTVKLRTLGGEGELSEAEKSTPPEFEWTNPDEAMVSRAKDHQIPPDRYNAVIRHGASPALLFSKKQRAAVAARLPELRWEDLIAHGPVHGEVWDRQSELKGFPIPVTVERWHLQRDGQSAEIFEVSAAERTRNQTEAKELAAAFFQAAENAGFGRSMSKTKTQMVLDFFRPAPAPAAGTTK